MNRKDYEQRLDELEREIAALKRENVEDESTPPHQRPKPERGEIYYYIQNHGGITFSTWCDTEFDLGRRAIGDVFRNKEAAEYAAEYYKVLAEMREWAGRWDDEFTLRYVKNGRVNTFFIAPTHKSYGEMRFATWEDAEGCIKAVGEDRIKKYYFMIPEDEADDD